MTECNKCGDCCDPVYLYGGSEKLVRDFLEAKPDREKDPVDRDFIWYNWTRIADNGPDGGIYECKAFDRNTRTCTAHEDRPDVCRRFPWYDKPPRESMLRDLPNCSFRADLPENAILLPLVGVS